MLTTEEQEKLLEKYLREHGKFVHWNSGHKPKEQLSGLPISTDAHHLVCGLCGVTSVQGRYDKHCRVVYLKNLPNCIALTEKQQEKYNKWKNEAPIYLPVDEKGKVKPFKLYKLQSAYTSKVLKKTFHVHPEFVHEITDEVNEKN